MAIYIIYQCQQVWYVLKCLNMYDGKIHSKNWFLKFFEILGPNTACSKGYVLVPGDIPRWGQIRGRIKTDADGCAKQCNDNKNCCSYEYSPRKKICNLNRACKPSRKKFGDFNFCAKGKELRRVTMTFGLCPIYGFLAPTP